MSQIKMLIADPSEVYLDGVTLEFLRKEKDHIDLHGITEDDFWRESCRDPEEYDIALINEKMVDEEVPGYKFRYIFILTESMDAPDLSMPSMDSIKMIYKWASASEVYAQVVNGCPFHEILAEREEEERTREEAERLRREAEERAREEKERLRLEEEKRAREEKERLRLEEEKRAREEEERARLEEEKRAREEKERLRLEEEKRAREEEERARREEEERIRAEEERHRIEAEERARAEERDRSEIERLRLEVEKLLGEKEKLLSAEAGMRAQAEEERIRLENKVQIHAEAEEKARAEMELVKSAMERAVAETEKLSSVLEKVRGETEKRVRAEIERVRREAEEELKRVRREAEGELERVRHEAEEKAREAERLRRDAEEKLRLEELEKLRLEEEERSRTEAENQRREAEERLLREKENRAAAAGRRKSGTEVILMHGSAGGAGKTAVALGTACSMSRMKRRVLYIDAEYLQNFQVYMASRKKLSREALNCLQANQQDIYEKMKGFFCREGFAYLPASPRYLQLYNVGMDAYFSLIRGAKASGDYDYIIVDTDNGFGNVKARLFSIADRAVIVSRSGAEGDARLAVLHEILNLESNADRVIYVRNFVEKSSGTSSENISGSGRDGDFLKTKNVQRSAEGSLQEAIVDIEKTGEPRSFEDLGRIPGIRELALRIVSLPEMPAE